MVTLFPFTWASSLHTPLTMTKLILVTGATGFIGAHIVDALLSRGLQVRGATRSMAKGNAMIQARPQFTGQLEFVQIDDFEKPGGLVEAVQGVDGVIHTASVSPQVHHQDIPQNEKAELIPAFFQ